MKAIIMAGGFGTRLRPVIGDRPKPMADILGRPIMEHILRHLRRCGFEDICAAVSYRAEDIMAHFGHSIQYRVETQPLGTAGAVKNCADFYADEDFLVISADAACDFDLARLMAEHKNSGAAVTVALCRRREPLRYGLALTDGAGFVRAFIEKPDWAHVVTDAVNTGIYIISPRVMELVPEGEEYDFGRQLFPELLRRGEKILGLEMEGYWRDMGTPADYYRCIADAWENVWKIHPAAAGGGNRQDVSTADAPLAQTTVQREGQKRQGGELNPSSVASRQLRLCPRGYPEEKPLKPSPPVPQRVRGGRWPSEARSDEGIIIPVSDRAGLMGIVSAELMELGADYAQGLRLKTPRFLLRLHPASEESALYLSVSSADEKLAGKLLGLMRDAIEKIEK